MARDTAKIVGSASWKVGLGFDGLRCFRPARVIALVVAPLGLPGGKSPRRTVETPVRVPGPVGPGDGLYEAMEAGPRDPHNPQFTDHYFTGEYPTPLTDLNDKVAPRQLSLLAEAPLSVPPLLLVGPLGTGKTQYSNALATVLGVPVHPWSCAANSDAPCS